MYVHTATAFRDALKQHNCFGEDDLKTALSKVDGLYSDKNPRHTYVRATPHATRSVLYTYNMAATK